MPFLLLSELASNPLDALRRVQVGASRERSQDPTHFRLALMLRFKC
jgi:hypothetical protein